MKSLRFWSTVAVALIFMGATPLFAQGDIQIFGFFQSYASQTFQKVTQTSTSTFITDTSNNETSVFSLQQANILASKDLGGGFGAFVNLEFVNNYSSDRGWGKFNIQEAFVKYEGSNSFNVKAGLFLPQFNNLYEIYNRMPLLPYIVRPFVYETALNTLLPPENYLPANGLAQVYGFFPAGETKIDYAVFIGNAEDSYIANNSNVTGITTPGWSTVSLKSIGARVGVRNGTLKVGASLTMDSENQRADTGGVAKVGSGDIPRMRIGGDISYNIAGFTLNGEVIMVNHTLTDAQKTFVAANPLLGGDMNKLFFYVSLQYDINDQYYVYGLFHSLKDNYSTVLKEPLNGFSGGVGFHANESVVIKLQYAHYQINSKFPEIYPAPPTPNILGGKPIFNLSTDTMYGGVSVAF